MAAMSLADLLTDVRAALRESSERRWKDVDLKRWINQGYKRACLVARLEKSPPHTFPTVVGEPTYDLPSEVLRIVRVYYGGKRLREASLETLEFEAQADGGNWLGAANGTPTHYLPWGVDATSFVREIRLWVPPDAAKTVTAFYYYFPGDLSANTHIPQIPEPYHPIIVPWAVSLAWDHVQEYNVALEYQARFTAMANELERFRKQERADLPQAWRFDR